MHPLEAKKSHIGTGRLTHRALINSEIIVGINFDLEKRFQQLINDPKYTPMVLYPGENSINLSEQTLDKKKFTAKIPLIFIIDGTWPCAKKIMKLTTSLHHLSRISFNPDLESKFDIKNQPAKFCLSTIESVYVVLSELERQEIESIGDNKETLLQALQATVNYHVEIAKDPSRNNYHRTSNRPKEVSQRRVSKKWENRSLLH